MRQGDADTPITSTVGYGMAGGDVRARLEAPAPTDSAARPRRPTQQNMKLYLLGGDLQSSAYLLQKKLAARIRVLG